MEPPHKHPTPSEVLDELKELWTMALPVTAMNCLVYIRAVVSVLFLGRLGSLELAGGALSIGFTNITGYSVLVGLASGLEPVCSQAYGSKNWDLLSLSLQRMILILLLAILPISILWINLGPIMVWMGQDQEITSMAATYCLYSLPDLLTNTLMQPLRVFLRSQVGNELGAGKPHKAKLAAYVALGCAFIIGVINVMWTITLKHTWASLFTNDESLKALVVSVMPIMGLCELGNCPQTTGCGILRGAARPVVGARINLGSFYFVGTPIAVGLAFWLGVGFPGLWYGLLLAQVACAASILYVVLMRTDWEAEAVRAKKLSGVELSEKSKSGEETKELLGSEGV